MSERDVSKYLQVREDALAAAAAALTVRTVFGMLDDLTVRFGKDFTIRGACGALDQLVKAAELTKKELQK